MLQHRAWGTTSWGETRHETRRAGSCARAPLYCIATLPRCVRTTAATGEAGSAWSTTCARAPHTAHTPLAPPAYGKYISPSARCARIRTRPHTGMHIAKRAAAPAARARAGSGAPRRPMGYAFPHRRPRGYAFPHRRPRGAALPPCAGRRTRGRRRRARAPPLDPPPRPAVPRPPPPPRAPPLDPPPRPAVPRPPPPPRAPPLDPPRRPAVPRPPPPPAAATRDRWSWGAPRRTHEGCAHARACTEDAPGAHKHEPGRGVAASVVAAGARRDVTNLMLLSCQPTRPVRAWRHRTQRAGRARVRVHTPATSKTRARCS